MADVYVEPRPVGRADGDRITHYILEFAHGLRVTNTDYPTQAEAIADGKKLGHKPLVSRVRVTDKGKPDQWRAA